MDKNTITGLLLITAIIIGFTIYNRPSREQIELEQRRRDSIAQVEASRATKELSSQAPSENSSKALLDQGSNVADFFSAGQSAQSVMPDSVTAAAAMLPDSAAAAFSKSAPVEKVVLENEKVRIVLNTLGGSIQSVQMKDYLRYTEDSLYLFEENESRFNMELF
ncbi:MAG TPA: hypothetical protein DDX07_09870, partial [Porphyromonadaceae bacterium]|nr:hypothetical protein [Porphyromonadaceae bacterium]